MRAAYPDSDCFPTVLYRNKNERQICTLAASGLKDAVRLSEKMICGRIMVNTDSSLVGLVDYGVGETGREKINPKFSVIDFETMAPYPVSVEIACRKKPEKIYGVRCRELKWKYRDGKVSAQVPLRGAEMLILKGKDLF
jgi:hypothetical protein